MNHHVARLLLMTAAMLVLAAPVFAQSGLASANIPFAFTVADKTLPGGDYLVRCDLSRGTIEIQGRDNGDGIVRLSKRMIDPTGAVTPKLIFHQIDGHYFLSQVWSGDGNGYQLNPSRLETEIATKSAAVVTVAAK